MYSFRMSFCSVPETVFPVRTLVFPATTRYIAHKTDAGELMVMETVVFSRSMPPKRISMSSSESMATAALADFTFAGRVIGVIAH